MKEKDIFDNLLSTLEEDFSEEIPEEELPPGLARREKRPEQDTELPSVEPISPTKTLEICRRILLDDDLNHFLKLILIYGTMSQRTLVVTVTASQADQILGISNSSYFRSLRVARRSEHLHVFNKPPKMDTYFDITYYS